MDVNSDLGKSNHLLQNGSVSMIGGAGVSKEAFSSEGFVGPIKVFEPEECRVLSSILLSGQCPAGLDWSKGLAPVSRVLYEAATKDSILDHVAELLGENVMLWGLTFVRRTPGQSHPWHTDMETSNPSSRTVSVWIGLANTNRNSALQIVPGSHRLGLTIQQVAQDRHRQRGDYSSDDLIQWARDLELETQIVQPEMSNGDALFFDGRLWHGSDNTNRTGERIALLAQYAAPDTPIRIPDFSELAWPFRFHDTPRPPCIVVRGTGPNGVNRMTTPPAADSNGVSITTCVRQLAGPLAEDTSRGWKPYHQFRGRTPNLADLSCHVSVLSPGKSPHPPHSHMEEEILVVLDGEAEAVLKANDQEQIVPLHAGRFAYYPPYAFHTIRNPHDNPVTYLMFKWKSDGKPKRVSREASFYDLPTPDAGSLVEPFHADVLFEMSTPFLRKLHSHYSTLQPGAGYEPHVDAHDVAILVRKGEIETLGQRIGPGGLVFYAAGQSHGIRNVGKAPAQYLVFEFHGRVPPIRRPGEPRVSHVARRVTSWSRQIARDYPIVGNMVRRIRRLGSS